MTFNNEYPDLKDCKVISMDSETYDPNLIKLGTGVFRNDGYVLGVSVATEKGHKNYYNIGHYDCNQELRTKNIEYLRYILALPINKLGANLPYDILWLEAWEGGNKEFGWRSNAPQFPIAGKLFDIQVAEALIDENQGRYSLDFLAEKYLELHKEKSEIQLFCDEHSLAGDPRKWLYKMPFKLVEKYAIADVTLPIDIFHKQWEIMRAQNLLDVFDLETTLLRATLKMRTNGARINTNLRDRNTMNGQQLLEQREIELFEKYGEFNYNSSPQVAKLFDAHNIPYPRKVTFFERGEKKQEIVHVEDLHYYERLKENNVIQIKTINPTITKDVLNALADEHPVASDINFVRKGRKIINTFLAGSLVTYITNNSMIHPSIHGTKTEANGTRTGRFSMSNPNLQNIPADKFWGNLCRECFIPRDNCWFVKIDYSQIEYRITAHFATGRGADELRATYNENPYTDYHQRIIDVTGLIRKLAKTLNFGVAYGMGTKKMAQTYNWSLPRCEDMLTVYHSRAPYVRATMNMFQEEARRKGFIKTILGRRSRLLDRKKAYTMFCKAIQGSAADLMKKAMVDVYLVGLMESLSISLTVHDELNGSVPKTAQGIKDMFLCQTLMENAIPLKVPVIADIELGTDWVHHVAIDMRLYEKLTGVCFVDWIGSLNDDNAESKMEKVMSVLRVEYQRQEDEKKAKEVIA